jgi:RimJ/RimL family protein N-acetyltransferase
MRWQAGSGIVRRAMPEQSPTGAPGIALSEAAAGPARAAPAAVPLAIPAIDTERLQLRGFELSDLADSVALWGDPRVTRHIGGRPFTAEEVWGRFLRHLGHWRLLGYGYWVVRERGTGAFVGEIGLADLHREIEPALGDRPEAGWVLSPAAQGRGFAREAVQAVLDWADVRFPGQQLVCLIDPDNAASIRVAERCGFRRAHATSYHGDPALIFERGGAGEPAGGDR